MRSRIEQASLAPVTLGILVIYLATFLGFRLWQEQDREYLNSLTRAGAMVPDLVAKGELWRLVTYAFLHAGLLHIACNGYFLATIGPVVERELYAVRYLALYLVSSVTGAVAAYFFQDPRDPLVGGSTGLFGLVGAMLAIQVRAGRYATEFLQWHSGRQLVNLVVANLVIGFLVPQISQAGHVGGLAGGFLFTFLYLRGRKETDLWGRLYQVGFALWLAALVLYCGHPFLRR